jgi:hypothetical protein
MLDTFKGRRFATENKNLILCENLVNRMACPSKLRNWNCEHTLIERVEDYASANQVALSIQRA